MIGRIAGFSGPVRGYWLLQSRLGSPVPINEAAGLLYFAFIPGKLAEIEKLRAQR